MEFMGGTDEGKCFVLRGEDGEVGGEYRTQGYAFLDEFVLRRTVSVISV